MNALARLNTLRRLYIFEDVSKEPLAQTNVSWWERMRHIQGKAVPSAFVNILLLTTDVSLLSLTFAIWFTSHASCLTTVGIEVLFLMCYALVIFARSSKPFLPSIALYGILIVLASVLNTIFPGNWGNIIFFVLCATFFYRFPLRWSIPLTILCTLAVIMSSGAFRLVFLQHPTSPGLFAFDLGLAAILAWFGWTRRVEYRLVVQLHEVQDQLREQMKRSEELATERERNRIARDIHDVLSHSLAVLSIQVQAARQLVTRDPERLLAKLDDMAALIRESITESRSVVGLLREKPSVSSDENTVSANLQSVSTTFSERTGIHGRFEETGTPHPLNQQQKETLQQALREMLTNAHRHGAAHTVWITLRWREANIVLEVRDDGVDTSEVVNSLGGHHGLQGMRERAAALGGEVNAGPEEAGGFSVILRLPYEPSNELATR